MRRAFRTACVAAATMVAGLASASADDLVLKFVTLDNPDAHHNVRIQHPWAERINQQANGLFRIRYSTARRSPISSTSITASSMTWRRSAGACPIWRPANSS